MPEEKIDSSPRLIPLLEEMLTWTKVGMYSSVRQLIHSQFGNVRDEERLAYELLDGKRKQGEIIKLCKQVVGHAVAISQPSLSQWAAKWERLGLVKKDGQKITRLFSLADFGISIPKLPKNLDPTSNSDQPGDQAGADQ